MQISPITNNIFFKIQNKNVNTQNKYFTKQSLTHDTINFTGQEDFLNLPKNEIFEKINLALKNPKNKLGEGGEAYVYKIPNTEYCVRINRDNEKDFDKTLNFRINKKDKINHIVAKLGKGSSIMTIVKGETLWRIGKDPAELAQNIETVEGIPIEGFKKLITQVCEADKQGMIFDSIGANIIVNPSNRSITAIDFFQSAFQEPFTPLKSIYASLTHFSCPITYKRNCAKKLILAACEDLREGKAAAAPFGGYDFPKLVHELAREDVIKDKKFTNTLYLVLDKISELYLQKYVGKECKSQFDGQMKVLNTLLKQVF
jgi:hypothetical protein